MSSEIKGWNGLKVYVVLHGVDYEGDEIVDIYKKESDARERCRKEVEKEAGWWSEPEKYKIENLPHGFRFRTDTWIVQDYNPI